MSTLFVVALVWAVLFVGLALALRFDREDAAPYAQGVERVRTIEEALREFPERSTVRQAG
jgi:hypothetical protein